LGFRISHSKVFSSGNIYFLYSSWKYIFSIFILQIYILYIHPRNICFLYSCWKFVFYIFILEIYICSFYPGNICFLNSSLKYIFSIFILEIYVYIYPGNIFPIFFSFMQEISRVFFQKCIIKILK